ARTVLEGPGPYDLTAELLADAAVHAQQGGMSGSGALGPVAAFGLDVLRERCAALGLHEVPAPD
ncbi:MAG: saccharopine dehydrogenase, partial [Actinomycetota bacterium]|nr:saccharopine dehydrogenase [Actinomycetota bacterium]